LRNNLLSACLSVLALVFTFTQIGVAATPSTSTDPLFQTISSLDAQLFAAIDRCDMGKEASMWAEDAEFYHDKNGLMTGRKNIVEAIRTNLCGKVKRDLVPGTLEVYPMNRYGAVEIGVHRFYHPGEKDHDVVGEAKFIHLWRYKDGGWQITRVISFDHGAMK
jgi:hypothetical protein